MTKFVRAGVQSKICLILILVIFQSQLVNAAYTSCVQNGDDSKCKITVVGFSTSEPLAADLKYSVSGKTAKPQFFDNINKYVRIEEGQAFGENLWSVNFQDIAGTVEFPSVIKKLDDISADEKEYLKSSFFIQTDKVHAIADDVANHKQYYDRMSASLIILRKLNAVLKYDHDQLAQMKSTNELPTTEHILQIGKGLCYEFSIVFTAAARSVGIPTRIIYGFVARDGKAGSHAWVEIKLNDNTWWPIDPQDSEPILAHKGYIPMYSSKMFDASGWAEAMETYKHERSFNMEWYDGGITVEQQDKDAP
jgi:transglutaminase/protease-like cytokinesis protein 3